MQTRSNDEKYVRVVDDYVTISELDVDLKKGGGKPPQVFRLVAPSSGPSCSSTSSSTTVLPNSKGLTMTPSGTLAPAAEPAVGPPDQKEKKNVDAIMKAHSLLKLQAMRTGSRAGRKTNIKVWINETIPLVINADSSGNFGFTCYLNDVRNLVDFTTFASLFDQYRLIEHKLVFDPAYNVTTGGTVQPGLVIAKDVDNTGSSAITTAGTANVLNYQGGRYPLTIVPSTMQAQLTWNFSNLPKKTDQLISSTELYAFPGAWTNCQSGAGNVGGFRAASINPTAASRPIGYVFRSWYVEFGYKFA